VAYYREQWQLERGFHRFKQGRLPALPIRHWFRWIGMLKALIKGSYKA
jgi:hypothetical protein